MLACQFLVFCRKALLVGRLRHLATLFAIESCAYAMLATHYNPVLRTLSDIIALWWDLKPATRWFALFPRRHDLQGNPM